MGRGHGRSSEETVVLPEMPVRTALEGTIGGLAFTDDPPNPWAIARTEELIGQIRAGDGEEALFLLSNYYREIDRSPLLRRIAERLAESLLKDGQGEELEGYARRLMVISGAELATTDELFGITDRYDNFRPKVHLRGEDGDAACGFLPGTDSNRYRVHSRAPRGSLQEPPSMWIRCEACLDLAKSNPTAMERGQFTVLNAAERKAIRDRSVERLIETLASRKRRPRRNQIANLLLEVQKTVRETTHRTINGQIVERLSELPESELFERWFLHWVCDPDCNEAHLQEHVRAAIKGNYSPRIDEIPFPSRRALYSALETMPRMPEQAEPNQNAERLLFQADLILSTWPAALPEIARNVRSTSRQQIYWRDRWPEALDGVKVKGDLDY